jgi:hypothetical protein
MFLCVTVSLSVCVCSWLECARVTCTVLCESVCELVECGQCTVLGIMR